jgi:hypothetical protein
MDDLESVSDDSIIENWFDEKTKIINEITIYIIPDLGTMVGKYLRYPITMCECGAYGDNCSYKCAGDYHIVKVQCKKCDPPKYIKVKCKVKKCYSCNSESYLNRLYCSECHPKEKNNRINIKE